ncbi:hypothetical protein FKM82_030274 [Ascaphus truei]
MLLLRLRPAWDPVSQADHLPQLDLGDPQVPDAGLHLFHLQLHQGDDVPLLVQLAQQLVRRGARRHGVRVVGGQRRRVGVVDRVSLLPHHHYLQLVVPQPLPTCFQLDGEVGRVWVNHGPSSSIHGTSYPRCRPFHPSHSCPHPCSCPQQHHLSPPGRQLQHLLLLLPWQPGYQQGGGPRVVKKLLLRPLLAPLPGVLAVLPLDDPPEGEDGGHLDAVGLPAAVEVEAAHPVAAGG